MDKNLTTIILAIIALFVTGGVFTFFKIVQNRNTNNSGRITEVKQKGIRAGGDVAGGDINKNTK